MAAAMDDAEQQISTADARPGATPHVTRYALGFGLALVVPIFLILMLVRA